MARPKPEGNRGYDLFPRLLRGLSRADKIRRPVGVEQSGLQQRLDLLVEIRERRVALDLLAIDKKGRCRIDLQYLAGIFLVGRDLVEQGLVLEAILDRLLAETGLLADPDQGFRGVFQDPLVLLLEQHVDDSEILARVVLCDAARQHRARRRLDVEREFAEHVTYLPGIDIFRLYFRKHRVIERRAMRAG